MYITRTPNNPRTEIPVTTADAVEYFFDLSVSPFPASADDMAESTIDTNSKAIAETRTPITQAFILMKRSFYIFGKYKIQKKFTLETKPRIFSNNF